MEFEWNFYDSRRFPGWNELFRRILFYSRKTKIKAAYVLEVDHFLKTLVIFNVFILASKSHVLIFATYCTNPQFPSDFVTFTEENFICVGCVLNSDWLADFKKFFKNYMGKLQAFSRMVSPFRIWSPLKYPTYLNNPVNESWRSV